MSVLLQWLVEYAWIFYVVCAIGALVYLVRAVSAQRQRTLALFTLEHETATVRAVRAWATVFAFTAIALVVFISVTFMVNTVPAYNSHSPTPTSTPSSGVHPATATAVPTLTEPAPMPTADPNTPTPLSPIEPPEPTEPSTPVATETPTPIATGALSGDLDVRFGDFGRLVSYEVSADQVSPGQPFLVTLYWQGLDGISPVNYTVFTHLISEDGRLVAQHDGPPSNGSAPTTSWQAGQIIRDGHQLAFRAEASDYRGPASVLVGLYDPANPDVRLVTSTGRDHVRLPVTISVGAP